MHNLSCCFSMFGFSTVPNGAEVSKSIWWKVTAALVDSVSMTFTTGIYFFDALSVNMNVMMTNFDTERPIISTNAKRSWYWSSSNTNTTCKCDQNIFTLKLWSHLNSQAAIWKTEENKSIIMVLLINVVHLFAIFAQFCNFCADL